MPDLFIAIALILIIMSLLIPSMIRRKETKAGNITEECNLITERIYPKSKTVSFHIAGISNYCNRSDIGMICGETIDEPGNKHDKNAVMVVDANKEKLLGYISKKDKKEYRDIAEYNTRMPFIGFIETFENDFGKLSLFGIIKVYSGDEKTVDEDINNDWQYLRYCYTIRSYEERIEALNQFRY